MRDGRPYHHADWGRFTNAVWSGYARLMRIPLDMLLYAGARIVHRDRLTGHYGSEGNLPPLIFDVGDEVNYADAPDVGDAA